MSHSPTPDPKQQQTQCDLVKVSQRGCWEPDQDCWHQVSYGTTRPDHILLPPYPFLSVIFICCQSWVLSTDYLSKTLFDWETEDNSSEAYHLSWRSVDDSEITRCQPQEAGPEEWPPAQAEYVSSGTVCSEVGSRWWCRHRLVYPSKGNEEGSLECLENYGQYLVRTFLPSSMRRTPQLVQGSGTSRISRGSLLERKIRSFKSE